MAVDGRIAAVTERIRTRSRTSRQRYLDRVERARAKGPVRTALSCGNLAHAFAGCGAEDKQHLAESGRANIAIVTAYNDMLSAHQPYETYPALIRDAVREAGGVAQVAGGVPAMCDGVTQGQTGMELSLASRDVVAMATAVALSHAMFDGALCLGICDKIVPGLVIASLAFGHLPFVYVPAGPMPSGLPNAEKGRIRQLAAEGKASRAELLKAEMDSYHSPGTCTFYGTANSNQMLMEIMGLHLPGASFVNPGTPLRDALTRAAARRVTEITALGNAWTPIGHVIDEKAVVNGIVGLMATGGSTNHTLHLVAMARAAGILIDWDDMADVSAATPLLARVYPNGMADVNQFHAAGGMAWVIGELLDAGRLHPDVLTVAGEGGLERYTAVPELDADGGLAWRQASRETTDPAILATAGKPFSADGGLKVLGGNLGRAVIKVSAVKPQHRVIEAPARVFTDQDDLLRAFKAGELNRDVVAVVRFQGPKANGMPELHKLTPSLGVLQDKGFKVALVTDGRMSGASGKVPAAIHVTPEAVDGGPIARVRDGDVIRVDAETGRLEALVDAAEWAARVPATADLSDNDAGCGRELFAALRRGYTGAEAGASMLGDLAA
ncbi:MAG: phosphogluconate dehydratase [Geminicoccaceae bacterium]